jgi:hypothetical protein
LLFSACGKVFKISPQKSQKIVFDNRRLSLTERPFTVTDACLLSHHRRVLILHPADFHAEFLYPKFMGRNLTMNDLVFDSKATFMLLILLAQFQNPRELFFVWRWMPAPSSLCPASGFTEWSIPVT